MQGGGSVGSGITNTKVRLAKQRHALTGEDINVENEISRE